MGHTETVEHREKFYEIYHIPPCLPLVYIIIQVSVVIALLLEQFFHLNNFLCS